MTKLQRHALRHMLTNSKNPRVPGSSYDENFTRTDAEELVPGTPNIALLDDPRYKAGWQQCYEKMGELILFIMTASGRDLIKYAGKLK